MNKTTARVANLNTRGILQALTTGLLVVATLVAAMLMGLNKAHAGESPPWTTTVDIGGRTKYPGMAGADFCQKTEVVTSAGLHHASGLSLGVWNTTPATGNGGNGCYETDVTAGYGGSVNKLSYNVGLNYYNLRGIDDAVTGTFGLSYALTDGLTVGASYEYIGMVGSSDLDYGGVYAILSTPQVGGFSASLKATAWKGDLADGTYYWVEPSVAYAATETVTLSGKFTRSFGAYRTSVWTANVGYRF